ncbi:DEAD/DEAH box helicase [Pseudonocardia abyssalis]|uniref:DEAD/DEAH box helicase n=1 Tax=Pseudonocardia abyssalis TaxID=2792008 RepID=A0ABS6URK6_9PSEU|nr:DEAD/DEAH box helicase [Pseudonocardia abyssalis]MBW0114308.1 DEAD/DEAH box helicase [Pseudonocardia abyssalis]MBW0134870.1 DEAD/DEAH box helicase [Pseudonocardia abyssalis]
MVELSDRSGQDGGTNRRARATLAAVRDLAERATTLLAAPAVLRDSARRQVEVLTAGQVSDRLRATPITALRELVGRGVRLGALQQAGVATVADVLAAPDHRLQQVPGVGAQTVLEVRRAARTVAVQVQRDVRFRIDPDRRDPAQTHLIAALAATRAADAASAALREPLETFVSRTGPLAAEADRAASRWSMLFSRRRTKDSALDALARLEAILVEPAVRGLHDAVAAQERAVDPASYESGALWNEYLQNAAGINAVLSTVGAAPPDDDAARGFVAEELRQRITAIPLDLSHLKATLRGYQVFGAQYAIHQERSILGDEMGLGKTVQALAVLAHLAAKGQRRFVVVCPASVQINWVKETAKHSTLATHMLHGAGRDDAGRRWLREGGVAVTTFGTLARLPAAVREADVAMLVVDEAHYVKNPDAARSQAIAAAVGRAQRALFLTGTPMENRVEEFRTLVNYLQPQVARNIDPADAVAGANVFRRAVAPVYLRRNQADVLTELPEKIETEAWVQFGDGEVATYRDAVQRRNLQAMRQAGFGPGSAKLERLREIVEEAAQDGMKVLVFSYFLAALETCAREFSVVGTITGSVPPAARQELVGEFAARPGHAVLLSQIEAGGVGMNLQAASVVVLIEPQWKPSTEDQAIARAHRMGQVRTVQVHRLLAKDSIDERIREIQDNKRLLFDHFARRSEAKESDSRSVDTALHRPEALDDDSVPMERRVLLAEQHRLGLS